MTKEEEKKKSIYEELADIDVKPFVNKKLGLDYLSWAKAWGLVKAIYPTAEYKFTEFPEFVKTREGWIPTGREVDYRLTPAGCEVEAKVTIDGMEFHSSLYVMDNKNIAIKEPDYGQINKAQMRALVKALAFAGLGLSVYAGEDLPQEDEVKSRKAQRSLSLEEVKRYRTSDYYGQEKMLFTIWQLADKEKDKRASHWWHERINEKGRTLDSKAVILYTNWAKKIKKEKETSA